MFVFYLTMIDEENDRIRFAEIYERYEGDVFRRIRRFLKNREDAEDAMQNTWLVITKNIEFYRELSDVSIKAYVLRVARNQAISLYRARRREADMTCDIDDFTIADDSSLVSICDRSSISDIVDCIDALDEIYSDVLNLHYLHHHTPKEIAKLLNLNEHTGRTRIARGREKLIHLLRRRGLYE